MFLQHAADSLGISLSALSRWAHARRKFDEAIKALDKPKKGQTAKAGKAQMGLSYIQKLYRIKKEIKDLSPEEKYSIRQERSLKALNELHSLLEKPCLKLHRKRLWVKRLPTGITSRQACALLRRRPSSHGQ